MIMQNLEPQVEGIEDRRKRLKFRAWHRGTRELDLLIGSFADRYLPEFGMPELDQFEALLNCQDPDVYDWMTGQKPAPEDKKGRVLDLLLQHRFAK
jgi:antitoxin CptB